jgi:hypothetical protein
VQAEREASLRTAAASSELQLAQDELDNRAIVAQLTAALRVGAIAGPVGAIDADAIRTKVMRNLAILTGTIIAPGDQAVDQLLVGPPI